MIKIDKIIDLTEEQKQTIGFEVLPYMGVYPWAFPKFIYGELSDIKAADPAQEITEQGGPYIYDDWGTAPIKYVSSSSINDNQYFVIYGLDIEGNELYQYINLNGQDNVILETPLWRVLYIRNEDSTETEGIVYCHISETTTAGVPDLVNLRCQCSAPNNQSLMAITTIPKGKVGFLYEVSVGMSRAVSSGSTSNGFYIRSFGKLFQLKKRLEIAITGTSIHIEKRIFRSPLTALSDIKLVMEKSSANDIGVFGSIDFILIDEDKFTDEYLTSIGQPGY